MDNFTFEAASLDALGRELRESALRVRDEVDKTVVVIAEDVKTAAEHESSRHSKSIPPTLKVRAVPGAAIISAGGGDVPLAALYELGNKGKGGRSKDTFRHPVFGGDVWVEQKRYPFLRPAMVLLRRQITKRMEAAWEQALRPLKLS